MILKKCRGIRNGNRNDRTAGFDSDFEGTLVEWEELQFAVIFISRAFRKNHDRDSAFYLLHGLQYGFQALADIGTV